MPTGDKQQPLLVKKVALRDLPNETRNIITSPQGTSLTKERVPFSDALKVSGTKRHHPDCPPSSHHQSACSTGTNGHLVYVRRKLEETGKSSNGDLDTTVPLAKKINGEGKELSHQQDEVPKPRVLCFPALSPIASASLTISSLGPSVPYSVGMAINGLQAVEPNSSKFSTATPAQSNSPSSCGLHWKDRFLMLQMYLNKCDQSNQEEYIKMLRSLSALGRSKHAVELEKRAIHLLLEEGKELRRMKLLNVLGKVSPN